MSENTPVEKKEDVEGGEGDNSGDQAGTPTFKPEVHWPGNP
jgi:hypothetical protein